MFIYLVCLQKKRIENQKRIMNKNIKKTIRKQKENQENNRKPYENNEKHELLGKYNSVI